MKDGKIVVMSYTWPNEYSCKAMSLREAQEHFKDLRIDFEKGTWSWEEWENIPIGKARSIYSKYHTRVTEGVIGVYDVSDVRHLDRMVKDAVEFHRPEPKYLDY